MKEESTLSDSDREIVSQRVFAASRGTVYEAFINPGHLREWWGPKGFTSTFHEFDPRVGGRWRLVLHGPDGTHYDNEKRFLEVVAGQRIVFRHEHATHGFVMTMLFADEGAGTELTWEMRFDSAEECAKIRSFVAAANEENFDRLAAYLPKMSP